MAALMRTADAVPCNMMSSSCLSREHLTEAHGMAEEGVPRYEVRLETGEVANLAAELGSAGFKSGEGISPGRLLRVAHALGRACLLTVKGLPAPPMCSCWPAATWHLAQHAWLPMHVHGDILLVWHAGRLAEVLCQSVASIQALLSSILVCFRGKWKGKLTSFRHKRHHPGLPASFLRPQCRTGGMHGCPTQDRQCWPAAACKIYMRELCAHKQDGRLPACSGRHDAAERLEELDRHANAAYEHLVREALDGSLTLHTRAFVQGAHLLFCMSGPPQAEAGPAAPPAEPVWPFIVTNDVVCSGSGTRLCLPACCSQ